MVDFSKKWLVETDWLQDHLNTPGLVVLDGSWSPNDGDTPYADYLERHIPGALFFDIDELSDHTTDLPHMLPSPEYFASRMKKMGIGDGMKIVVYDSKGLFSAARIWWMFRVMGHNDVVVLNGGLKKWQAEARVLESGEPASRGERHFTPRKNSELVRDLSDMKRTILEGRIQIADARSKSRFDGQEIEPRPVPNRGHMPDAHNVHYASLIAANGMLKSASDIRTAFETAGIAPEKAVITTCGSGITACILALGLAVIGNEHVAVYDGSWAEWGQAADVPVVQGKPSD